MRSIVILLLLPILAISQANRKVIYKEIPEDSIISKWIKACINVETRASQKKYKIFLSNQVSKGNISSQAYRKSMDSLFDNPLRFTGTMVFLEDNGFHFLLTAKHVVIDASETEKDHPYFRFMLIENNTSFAPNEYMTTDSLGDVTSNHDFISFTSFNENNPTSKPLDCSSDSDDIAIVVLDSCLDGIKFIKGLYDRGYKPIHLSDIDSICKLTTASKVYAVGFPEESRIGLINMPKVVLNWESNIVSVPIISKGTLVKSNDKGNTFESDIFTYHGNSGGPIIRNDKLIGIVSGFNLDTFNLLNPKKILSGYIKYRSRFIKSSLLYKMFIKMKNESLLLSGNKKLNGSYIH